jgi:hypothetical protein
MGLFGGSIGTKAAFAGLLFVILRDHHIAIIPAATHRLARTYCDRRRNILALRYNKLETMLPANQTKKPLARGKAIR